MVAYVLILFLEADSLKLNIMHNLEEQFDWVNKEIIISESFKLNNVEMVLYIIWKEHFNWLNKEVFISDFF